MAGEVEDRPGVDYGRIEAEFGADRLGPALEPVQPRLRPGRSALPPRWSISVLEGPRAAGAQNARAQNAGAKNARARAAQPPMADIGRAGCRKPGSLMPWPGSLDATARRQSAASSASLAPDRSDPRRSLSAVANRQLRTWPSAVSLTRSQVPQNGRVTDPITPIRARPPLTSNASAGAEPPAAGSSGLSANSADRTARISSAVTMAYRRPPGSASR